MYSGGMSMVIRSQTVDVAANLAKQHLGPRRRQLEALATHLLDQDRELELTAAANLDDLLDSAGRTSIETLPRTSFSSRALIWRLVTYLPSRPASGDVFTPNVMRSVGASTSSLGSGRGSAGSVSVSPIVTSGKPATLTMSPGPACSISTRSFRAPSAGS